MALRQDIDDMIAFLNSIVAIDEPMLRALIAHHVPCNKQLADHPSIQVSPNHECGLLGLLNGYFGTIDGGPRDGWGGIVAMLRDDGSIIRFQRTTLNDPAPGEPGEWQSGYTKPPIHGKFERQYDDCIGTDNWDGKVWSNGVLAEAHPSLPWRFPARAA